MAITALNQRDNIEDNYLMPPKWNYQEDLETLNQIGEHEIISYNFDGSVCSYYGDNLWKLTYSLNSKRYEQINFAQITSETDLQLIKRIMFIIIHFSRGKKGTVKAPATLKEYYLIVLLQMYKYSKEKNVSIFRLLESKKMTKNYISSTIKKNQSRARVHKAFLTILHKLPKSISGVSYKKDITHFELLAKYNNENKNNHNQSECIPPRILQNSQNMRWEHINKIKKHLPKLLQLIDLILKDPLNYYSTKSNARKRAQLSDLGVPENFITFKELIAKISIEKFCNSYNIKDRISLQYFLSKLSYTSRHLIYGYTGMRNDEGCLLEINCFKNKGACTHPIINGIEKKNGIPQLHPFVTIKEIKKVIDIQASIAKTIANHTHPNIVHLPLLFNSKWIHGSAKYLEAVTDYPEKELPLDESKLILTKDELKNTLEATEPDRDWANDKNYKVGKVWKFKWHQYRRTIAVYALNTGLVSLAALGKQFRHLFEATTIHYGNGHFVAQPLAGTDSQFHVKSEMDKQRPEYEALAMYRNIMFNLERPESRFSPKAETNNDITPEEQIVNPSEPNTIVKKLKNGHISYTNTAIGSCKSIQPCDGHIMLFFAGCVGCSDAEVNDKKLENTINSLKNFKQHLETHMPNSVESRDTNTDLEALIKLKHERQGDKSE